MKLSSFGDRLCRRRTDSCGSRGGWGWGGGLGEAARPGGLLESGDPEFNGADSSSSRLDGERSRSDSALLPV